MNDETRNEWEAIECYRRSVALAEGKLVDVTEAGKEAGLTYSVALTRRVYDHCVVVPTGVEGQDRPSRLWHVLWGLRITIWNEAPEGNVLRYEVLVKNDDRGKLPIALKAVSGPSDDGSRCITIMLSDEAVPGCSACVSEK